MRAAFAACLSFVLAHYGGPLPPVVADAAPTPVIDAVQGHDAPHPAPHDARSRPAESRLQTVEPAPLPAAHTGIGQLARVRSHAIYGADCAFGTRAQIALPPCRAPPTHS